MRHPLYQAALDADEAFQEALERHYGTRAGDMRYRTREQTPEIRALGSTMHTAADAWRAYMRRCERCKVEFKSPGFTQCEKCISHTQDEWLKGEGL